MANSSDNPYIDGVIKFIQQENLFDMLSGVNIGLTGTQRLKLDLIRARGREAYNLFIDGDIDWALLINSIEHEFGGFQGTSVDTDLDDVLVISPSSITPKTSSKTRTDGTLNNPIVVNNQISLPHYDDQPLSPRYQPYTKKKPQNQTNKNQQVVADSIKDTTKRCQIDGVSTSTLSTANIQLTSQNNDLKAQAPTVPVNSSGVNTNIKPNKQTTSGNARKRSSPLRIIKPNVSLPHPPTVTLQHYNSTISQQYNGAISQPCIQSNNISLGSLGIQPQTSMYNPVSGKHQNSVLASLHQPQMPLSTSWPTQLPQTFPSTRIQFNVNQQNTLSGTSNNPSTNTIQLAPQQPIIQSEPQNVSDIPFKEFDPSTRNDQYTLIKVDPNSDEFKTVVDQFKSTLRHAKIKNIYCNINAHLEHMYEINKEVIDKRNPNMVNERRLFHGTTLEAIEKICKLGFNRSYCGKNGCFYGRGVYFARDASYSHDFSAKPVRFIPNSVKYMILARVLVGSYEVGNGFTIEPGYRQDGNQHDSTVDSLANPAIFVIYRDYRAYPNYLIEYDQY